MPPPMATADFNDSYRPCIEQNGTALRNKDLASSGTSPPLDEKIEPIAVIGFSARLPQEATTGEAFWRMLSEGRSAMTDIPKERFNVDAFYHPNADRTDATNVKTGHFLTGDMAAFDAPFFSIQASEVSSMDPQQRSGIAMESVIGSKTSVYVGTSSRDYEAILLRDSESPAKYLGTGVGTSLLANRVSWFYDLRGPSIALDTACSSSLVALHLACQSLRNHESNMALVGGCNMILAPDVSMVHLSNMGFFSPDGRSYCFDSRANGYAKGEGVGVVVIKRLHDALRDGDTIRAIIRNTGVNQDGRTPGITQPSKTAQEANIKETYSAAGLDLDTTQFFEAHGTGTQIGDSIEAAAISAAFKRAKDNPLYIGAVKSNIGHLESGSGVASLIKTVLVLEKGLIPPNLWFEQPNKGIPLEEWHIQFPAKTVPWPTDGLRRASVNSFGYGGTNAHVILEDAYNYLKLRQLNGKHHAVRLPLSHNSASCIPQNGDACLTTSELQNGGDKLQSTRCPKLFVWSAADEAGLKRQSNLYQQHLSNLTQDTLKNEDEYLGNLCYTLSNKRSNLPWKSYVIASSISDLQANIQSNLSKPVRSSIAPCLSFVFTGQGAQWYAMGRELFAYPVFQASLQKSEQYLHTLGSGWSLIDELYKDKGLSNIDSPSLAQPLCTALQIALTDLLASWKIVPVAVVGHSSGEIAAAYCAGGLSFESALTVAFYRGALAARLVAKTSNPGAMTSVALSESEVEPYLAKVASATGGTATVGSVNSPKNVTITGDCRSVESLNTLMDHQGIFARKLKVNLAYHSPYMQAIASEYSTRIHNITARNDFQQVLKSSAAPTMFSSVTGNRISVSQVSVPDYWVTNMVSKVRFSDALSHLTSYILEERERIMGSRSGKDLLIEIGPHSALQRPVKDTISEAGKTDHIGYDFILERNVSALRSCLSLIGRLRCSGYIIDLIPINSPKSSEAELRMLTDLPEYPFNHSQTFWQESRISKNFRFRNVARHELLGTPSADWNPLEPKWRNIIKMSDNPWIEDHKGSLCYGLDMDGTELYPAAGMIVMAIEAARQIADPTLSITGYRLSDLSFSRALVVSSDPEGVETQLHLRPQKRNTKTTSECSDFVLYVYSKEEWAQVCQGTITTEYARDELDVADVAELDHEQSRLREDFAESARRCKEPVDSKQFYENLAIFGFGFGPTFRGLHQIYYNDTGEATARLSLDDWTTKISSDILKDHVIHPTDLDCVLQLGMAALTRGSWVPTAIMVPAVAKSIWISNNLLTRGRKEEINVCAKTVFKGYREVDFWYAAINTRNEVQILIDGWRITALSKLDAASSAKFAKRRLCYHTAWKPDLEMLGPEQTATYCSASIDSSMLQSKVDVDQLEMVCLQYMSSVLQDPPHSSFEGPRAHLARYVAWIKHHFDERGVDELLSSEFQARKPTTRENNNTFLDNFAKQSAEGALAVAVGKNLNRIFRAELDALDLLFSGTLVQDYYHSSAFSVNYKKIATYVDLLAHKHPDLSILEIGAGTGAATAHIIDTLVSSCDDNSGDESTIPRFSQYTYTDISPAFLEEAKKRFESYSDRMAYRVLDIEKDPLQQDFQPQKYDLVVCSMVLHATADLCATLKNVRTLLKPGGKLVLVEPSNPKCARVSFIFGLLSGWWLGTEENRQWCPLLCDPDWHDMLLKNGFSGNEVCIPDYSDTRHTFSAIISTALEKDSDGGTSQKTLIIANQQSSLQRQVAQDVTASLRSIGIPDSEVVSMQHIQSRDLKDTLCICLLEIVEPFLAQLNDEDFEALKILVASASGLLWVTQGCGELSKRPGLALVTGFGRAVCSENWNINFVELALELKSSPTQVLSQITKVYQKCLLSPTAQSETEYMEKDGKLCISRVVEANNLNNSVHAKLCKQQPEIRSIGQEPKRALSLQIATPGLLDTLQFEDDDLFEQPMAADEVEIEVKAIGVNFKDVMIALGRLPSDSIGFECAGVVKRAGNTGLRVGDRVCCCAKSGAFKTLVRAQRTAVAKIPDGVSFRSAAALPVVFCTAYYSLIHVARLTEGESILIHSGAGGVGQAAIQIARGLKAKIFTTVGTAEKKRFLLNAYGIPEDHIFSSRDASFTRGITRLTKGAGVDVVLNSLSDENLRASWSCIATFGRFIELGKTDIQSRNALPMDPFARGATFTSVDLGLVMDKARPLMETMMKRVMTLVTDGESGISPPQPLQVYSVSKLEEAFRLMQSGKSMGKIVIEMDETARVPVVPSTKPTYYFDEDATYLIAGGLGGLGRAITRWMADRKASNFILLSRSGAKGEDALELLREMRARGVNIAVRTCDISSEDALISVLKQHEHMPPIKGCIQATMVLKDGLFQNMSKTDFDSVIKPKVNGSWNLHKHLPRDVDFFVLLSSIGGMTGSRGQTNYAAGNTYQDALARHRVSQGLKCISLDLGSVLSVGFAAEKNLSEILEAGGFQGIRKQELLALLDWACDPSLPLPTPLNSQVVTGLGGVVDLTADRLKEVYWTRKPLFSILRQMKTVDASSSLTSTSQETAVDYPALLRSAHTPAAAEDIVIQGLVQKLSKALSIPIEDIEVQKPIHAFGVDSLVALEVRYWFMKEMKADLTVFDIMSSANLLGLSRVAVRKSECCQEIEQVVGKEGK